MADRMSTATRMDRARANDLTADLLQASEDLLRDVLDLVAAFAGCAFDLGQQPVRHEVNHRDCASGHCRAEGGTGVAALDGFAAGFV